MEYHLFYVQIIIHDPVLAIILPLVVVGCCRSSENNVVERYAAGDPTLAIGIATLSLIVQHILSFSVYHSFCYFGQ